MGWGPGWAGGAREGGFASLRRGVRYVPRASPGSTRFRRAVGGCPAVNGSDVCAWKGPTRAGGASGSAGVRCSSALGDQRGLWALGAVGPLLLVLGALCLRRGGAPPAVWGGGFTIPLTARWVRRVGHGAPPLLRLLTRPTGAAVGGVVGKAAWVCAGEGAILAGPCPPALRDAGVFWVALVDRSP